MKNTLVLFSLFLLNIPLLAFAAEPAVYKPLIGLPNGINANSDFNSFINALYAFSITIAALLAVIKIIIAGVKYMLTDVVTTKGDAKKDILGALIGLLVVLSAVLILTVVNPDTVNVELKLPGQVNPPYTGSAAPPVVLDTSKIVTTSPTPGMTAKFIPASVGQEQLTALKNSCPTKLADGDGVPQQRFIISSSGGACLNWQDGKALYDYSSNSAMSIAAQNVHCLNHNGGGVYFTDPLGGNHCYFNSL
jgi:hypothetical protein